MVLKVPVRQRIDPAELNLTEKVIQIRRVSKVVAGGRRLNFNAMVVVGDGEGHVGIGLGRATAVPDAVRKGASIAKKNLVRVPLKGNTVPRATVSKYRASHVLVKPGRPGTGIIAGGPVRAVMDQAGVKDVVTKSLGSQNHINVAKAAVLALRSTGEAEQEAARREAWRQFDAWPQASDSTEPAADGGDSADA